MEKWCLIYALPVILKPGSGFKKRQTFVTNHPYPKQCSFQGISISLYYLLERYFKLQLLISTPGGFYFDLPNPKLNIFSPTEFSSVAFIPANFRF